MMHSLYAHLWSIGDRGVAAFADDLERAGLNAVSYAATYHRVRQLVPAGGRRRQFFSEHSRAYFLPRDRYGRIRPLPSPLLTEGAGPTVPDALHAELDRRGMRLKAWVIGCHNTDLALAHPDCAVRNALGDASPHHLCPSQPDVQEYLAALLADFAGQYAPHAFELESFDHPGRFEHGAHHEMCGVPLDAFHSLLLALCLCPACRGLARSRGVDADRLAAAVREELLTHLATPAWRLADRLPDATEARAAFAAAHPEFEPFLAARREGLRTLGFRLRAAVREVADTRLTPIGLDAAPGDLPGQGWIDGLVTVSSPEAVRSARSVAGAEADVVCGIYPMAPRPLSPERIAEALRTCAAAGCTGFNYYNHALMQESTFEDIRHAIGALRG